ncbi:MAG TPA: hypothetical protein VG347_00560 [Verrucomicrobiae bacterium]|nr:hypothetical protein [Verrucomicrobiae bacterium]
MNTTTTENKNSLTNGKTFTAACLGACEKIAKQIGQAKDSLVAEFKGAFQNQELTLQFAIAEADALARQTEYPHLLFPVLATEKLQAAAYRQSRQHYVRQSSPVYAFAA